MSCCCCFCLFSMLDVVFVAFSVSRSFFCTRPTSALLFLLPLRFILSHQPIAFFSSCCVVSRGSEQPSEGRMKDSNNSLSNP